MNSEFTTYQAQTTPHPLALEIARANGSYVYDTSGKAYLDFIAGVSACSLGHQHPAVKKAIAAQLDKYLHVMVYGEFVQETPLALCKLLAHHLPEGLETTYLVNSGTEAIDGAIKLARRATGRSEIIAALGAYHGNSYGALSLMSNQERIAPFRPGIGDVSFIPFNCERYCSFVELCTPYIYTINGSQCFLKMLLKNFKNIFKKWL